MILPALGDIVSAAQGAARRFPLVLVAGLLTAIAGILLLNSGGERDSLARLMAATSLGLPLFFGLTVLAERRAGTRLTHWLIAASGLLILLGFWYAWPQWTETMRAIRFVQLLAALHLFVAVAPFIGHREPNAF